VIVLAVSACTSGQGKGLLLETVLGRVSNSAGTCVMALPGHPRLPAQQFCVGKKLGTYGECVTFTLANAPPTVRYLRHLDSAGCVVPVTSTSG
jgi:hypothetical protein